MNKIPVVIVDDDEIDRYVVKRLLQKHADFAELMEAQAGDEFLHSFFNGNTGDPIDNLPLVVLMDINMPRMNGFETVREIQARRKNGKGPRSVVVMMVTSSNSANDRKETEGLETIQGYIVKPLDDAGIDLIRDLHSRAS